MAVEELAGNNPMCSSEQKDPRRKLETCQEEIEENVTVCGFDLGLVEE